MTLSYEEWCETEANYDWWEYVYADWIEKLGAMGITGVQIAFSGFYSQGDGAHFTGRVEVAKFLEAHGMHTEPLYAWFYLITRATEQPMHIVPRASHHAHENTVGYEVTEHPMDWCAVQDTPNAGILLDMSDAQIGDMWAALNADSICGDIFKRCQDYMRDIYRQLKEEYEYVTGEEAYQDWRERIADD